MMKKKIAGLSAVALALGLAAMCLVAEAQENNETDTSYESEEELPEMPEDAGGIPEDGAEMPERENGDGQNFGAGNRGNFTAESGEDFAAEDQENFKGDRMNQEGGAQIGQGGRGGNQTTEEETDPEILAVIEAGAEKFSQFTFEDAETGISLEYSLYIPEDYDENEPWPLIMFIPDSTGAGKTAKEIVEQYYGADVWVSEEEQEKHASFVLVPAFSETVVDDNWNTSEQIEVAVRLLESLTETYSVDANRLYTTGQSMGCMTSLYLNSEYPELFAASLFVSGQWDISVLEPLEGMKFFYITAGGDTKASGGQDEVMAMFDADGTSYSYATWSAQNAAEEQDQAVSDMLAEGNLANLIRFETGSVLNNGSGTEHMASFNYAYKITAVRDWLFEQTK